MPDTQSRAYHFTLDDVFPGFTMAHDTGRIGLTVGPHDHSTTLHMSPTAARAMANALYQAADHAEATLPTGLGESAVDA